MKYINVFELIVLLMVWGSLLYFVHTLVVNSY